MTLLDRWELWSNAESFSWLTLNNGSLLVMGVLFGSMAVLEAVSWLRSSKSFFF